MAHVIPERILDFDPESREDVVFNALKEGLSDDYWVFHSLKINQTSSNGVFYEKEGDFVVFHREKGLLCLEVKNGPGISYYGGVWRYTSGRPMAHHGPFHQAQMEGVTLRNLLSLRGEETASLAGDARFRDITGRCKVLWGVWFHGMSRASVDAIQLPAEAPRDRILTLDDLVPEKIQAAIDRLFAAEVPGGVETRLSKVDADWLLQSVLAPSIPDLCPSVKDGHRFAEVIYAQLIREQSRVLDFLEGQHSAVINGMAGTGKTFVALERTRRCALRGERTLYLCFNTALRDYLKSNFVQTNPTLAAQVDFMTLDDFVGTLSRPLPADFMSRTYEIRTELQSARYAEAAEKLLDALGAFPYTQVIVDEGQDCAIPFIEKSGLMETLRDVVVAQENPSGCTSSFFMFYDALQIVSVSARTKAELPPVIRDADCKLTLYKNCRNTCSIAEAATRGVRTANQRVEMAAGAPSGSVPEIHFVAPDVAPEALVRSVSDVLADLRKICRADEIAILSCAPQGVGHSCLEGQVKTKSETGERVFNQVYRFSTYRKFKGLDAAAIILVDVEKSSFLGAQKAMPFYEGASRARQKLVVFAQLSDEVCHEIVAALDAKAAASVRPGREQLAELFKMKISDR